MRFKKIIPELDFKDLDNKTLEFLEKQNVFKTIDLNEKENSDNHEIITNNFFVFQEKKILFSDEVAEEVYNEIDNLFKDFDELQIKIGEIKSKLLTLLKEQDKISYLDVILKKEYKERYNLLMTLFLNENHPDYFKDNMIREIKNHPELIWYYISNGDFFEDQIIFFEMQKGNNENPPTSSYLYQWLNCIMLNEISNFCNDKYLEIKGVKKTINKSKPSFTRVQKILLLEKIRHYDYWEELSASKKGEILSTLLEYDKDNIKKAYLMYDGKSTKQSKRFISDKEFIDDFFDKMIN